LREFKLYINDIRAAIDKISEYVEGISFEDFKGDSKTYDSVLHNLMVIGEAAARIPDDIREKNSYINWRGIIGMRNIIAHGYFKIDPDIVWATIKERLPELSDGLDSLDY
jgi:uncharacterized protein with HEPN domain